MCPISVGENGRTHVPQCLSQNLGEREQSPAGGSDGAPRRLVPMRTHRPLVQAQSGLMLLPELNFLSCPSNPKPNLNPIRVQDPSRPTCSFLIWEITPASRSAGHLFDVLFLPFNQYLIIWVFCFPPETVGSWRTGATFCVSEAWHLAQGRSIVKAYRSNEWMDASKNTRLQPSVSLPFLDLFPNLCGALASAPCPGVSSSSGQLQLPPASSASGLHSSGGVG